MSTLGDAADVNPVIKFLPHTCNARVWHRRGRNSRRELWITLYVWNDTLSYLLYTGTPVDVQFSYINEMEPSATILFRRVRKIAKIEY